MKIVFTCGPRPWCDMPQEVLLQTRRDNDIARCSHFIKFQEISKCRQYARLINDMFHRLYRLEMLVYGNALFLLE